MSDNSSPKVEQYVEENWAVDAAAFFTNISKNNTNSECINALYPIHVEYAKHYSLEYVGTPEWQGSFYGAKHYTAEYKLLTDWCKNYWVKK